MTSTHAPGCECCTGLADRTPLELFNRPGLPRITYRVGAYPQFRASMLAGLTRESRPALAGLKTRDSADFSIGLIEAWAVAADVLTFYTERIANEHYLGTATERRSVGELAALLGYRLKPGVAAQTWLAFTLETTPGAPPESKIPLGAKVQTVPGPGEVPQTFETIEELDAVAAWNAPGVAMREPRVPQDGDTTVLLAGAGTGIRRGATLLFVADDWNSASESDRWCRVRVTGVAPDGASGTTTVTFTPALSHLAPLPGVDVRVHVLHGQSALFGFNAPDPRLFENSVKTALEDALTSDDKEWDFDGIEDSEVFLDGLYEGIEPGGWAVLEARTDNIITRGGELLILEGRHPEHAIASGQTTHMELAPIDSVRETAKSGYALSGRVTALELGRDNADLTQFGGGATRATIVHFRSEEFALADSLILEPLLGSAIPLASPVPANSEPRRVLVRGKRARASGDLDGWPGGIPPQVIAIEEDLPALGGDFRWTLRPESGEDVKGVGSPSAVVYHPALDTDDIIGEIATVRAAPGSGMALDTLALEEPLANVYDRQGATPIAIFGNVADATHGETVASEVLGSGDGARPFQRFTLRKPPLTYVQSGSGSGSDSTLTVSVNGIAWQEAETLFATGRRDRLFTTATTDDGKTTVTFGDGEAGARLPTGVDNVVATYRSGAGLAGIARAEQLTLAMTRPLGLKSVTNPLPASGAQDLQQAEDARENAPRSVLTLGRVVSLQDFADFSTDFPGIGKATATWTWDGRQRGVLVTAAAAEGKPVPEGSLLLSNLRTALLDAGSSRVPLVVRDFTEGRFSVSARLRIRDAYEDGMVRAAVEAALRSHYAFERRSFGEGVSVSELAEVITGIAGVEAVHIERLHRAGEAAALVHFLPAAVPAPGGPPTAMGAEILMLDPETLTLEVGW